MLLRAHTKPAPLPCKLHPTTATAVLHYCLPASFFKKRTAEDVYPP